MQASRKAVRLWGERSGQGRWVTLLHALGVDHSIWSAQVAKLSTQYSVLALDLRGHGRSAVPVAPYSLSDLAADVVGAWDELGITQSDVVGISIGGFVGQHLAFEYPERVRRLMLADTLAAYPPVGAAGWPERIRVVATQGVAPFVEGTLERWFTPAWRAANPQRLLQIRELIANTPREGYIGCCAAIAGLDTRSRLGAIRAPTLVVCGEHDVGTPPDLARELASMITGAHFAQIADAAHLACVEQPETFNRLLSGFLSG